MAGNRMLVVVLGGMLRFGSTFPTNPRLCSQPGITVPGGICIANLMSSFVHVGQVLVGYVVGFCFSQTLSPLLDSDTGSGPLGGTI